MKPLDLELLRLRQGGRLFRTSSLKPLSKRQVGGLLSAIVNKAGRQVNTRVLRKQVEKMGMLSVVTFKTERKPAFISESDILTDTIHGYCAIFEHGSYMLITTEKVAWSEKLGSGSLDKFTRGEMSRYAGHGVTAHETISVRSLDVGESQYRAQRIEGSDLAQTYPQIGANRRLLTSLSVRKGRGVPDASLSFSSSSVKTPGGRLGYRDWCRWARSVLDDVAASQAQGVEEDRFINSFARPIDLEENKSDIKPTAVFLWTSSFTLDANLDQLKFTWEHKKRGSTTPTVIRITPHRVQYILEQCRKPMPVSASATGQVSTINAGNFLAGTKLRQNKSPYSLRNRWSPYIRVTDPETEEKSTLTEWLRRKRCIHVTFSDATYAYSDNTLFQDATIASQMPAVQSMIRGVSGIKSAMSEKDGAGSLFELLESKLKTSDVLICDDDPGEWADYIALDKTSEPSEITFVHAKTGQGNIAPAEFHDVVSQALKNLGKRHANRDEIQARLPRWSAKTRGIQRVRRGGTPAQAMDSYLEVSSRHDHVFRVVLAVNFLSRKAVDNTAKKALERTLLNERETLLIWLLSGFMSHCRTVGAVPEVWCKP